MVTSVFCKGQWATELPNYPCLVGGGGGETGSVTSLVTVDTVQVETRFQNIRVMFIEQMKNLIPYYFRSNIQSII